MPVANAGSSGRVTVVPAARKIRFALPATAVIVLAIALGSTGCSSTPAFCSDVDTLRTSVNDLVSVEVNSNTINEVQTDFEKVQTDADNAVQSAREDFPEETSNLEDQIDATKKAIEDLPSSPAAGDYVALGLQVVALGKAADDFRNAAESACN